MTPADRLIVALDGDTAAMGAVFLRIHINTPIRWFKISPGLLLQHSGMTFVENMMREDGVNLMYDGKIYDTRDTVERTVKAAFDLGARFVTVHATPSVMEAAMRAKPADERCKVLAVSNLSDNPVEFSSSRLRYALSICDGAICSGRMTEYVRQWISKDKLLVCPGIRRRWPVGYINKGPESYSTPVESQPANNHVHPTTPAEALCAGADYLVVGRPIWQAPDPVAAARAIIAEMETA